MLLRAAVAVLLAAPLAGCVDVVAAGVPTPLLSAAGWRENLTARQEDSASFGFTRVVARVYDDPAPGRGHPGRLQVVTLKAPVTPDEGELVPRLRAEIEARARAQGIRLGDLEQQGRRTLANGATSEWFAYNGSAEASGQIFSRNAEVRILGEVWTCRPSRTVVAVVGFAQVTDARTVGGLLTNPNRDATTWNEVVADPSGTIEGARGTQGLAWNVVCA